VRIKPVERVSEFNTSNPSTLSYQQTFLSNINLNLNSDFNFKFKFNFNPSLNVTCPAEFGVTPTYGGFLNLKN
tara:strand:- start:218 stop:436 length:219 start_codon:yes stop_codon:yes gene_type:complete